MIKVTGLTKKYGRQKPSVSNLSFEVPKGQITGFLGPNGSGKSTTMRVMLELDSATEGEVTIDGQRYGEIDNPLTVVGALLDASAINPRITAHQHLHIIAVSNGIDSSRVNECLDMVGLNTPEIEKKKIGDYSLGMKQRLGIAAALLGDPDYLILDEPVNGLDPVGIHWVKVFVQKIAQEGKGVLISSHLLAELSEMVDHVVIIGKGEMIAAGSVDEILNPLGVKATSVVNSVDNDKLKVAIIRATGGREDAVSIEETDEGLEVSNVETQEVAQIAMDNGILLTHLSQKTMKDLEAAFLNATSSSQEFLTESK